MTPKPPSYFAGSTTPLVWSAEGNRLLALATDDEDAELIVDALNYHTEHTCAELKTKLQAALAERDKLLAKSAEAGSELGKLRRELGIATSQRIDALAQRDKYMEENRRLTTLIGMTSQEQYVPTTQVDASIRNLAAENGRIHERLSRVTNQVDQDRNQLHRCWTAIQDIQEYLTAHDQWNDPHRAPAGKRPALPW